jgi:hypothetical protein
MMLFLISLLYTHYYIYIFYSLLLQSLLSWITCKPDAHYRIYALRLVLLV